LKALGTKLLLVAQEKYSRKKMLMARRRVSLKIILAGVKILSILW
jgi:hypothetical protein